MGGFLLCEGWYVYYQVTCGVFAVHVNMYLQRLHYVHHSHILKELHGWIWVDSNSALLFCWFCQVMLEPNSTYLNSDFFWIRSQHVVCPESYLPWKYPQHLKRKTTSAVSTHLNSTHQIWNSFFSHVGVNQKKDLHFKPHLNTYRSLRNHLQIPPSPVSKLPTKSTVFHPAHVCH